MAEFSFSWERDAMRGDRMPPGLDVFEEAAYQGMARLYERFKAHQISKEDGAAEKIHIRDSLDKARARAAIDCKYERLHGEWVQKTSDLIAAYKTAVSEGERLEIADEIVAVIDGEERET